MNMKHILFGLAVAGILAACSGEPPKWWNPSQKYTADTAQGTQTKPAAAKRAVPRKEQEIKEESITPMEDTSFEEVDFQPLQDNPLPEGEAEAPAAAAPAATAEQAFSPSILAEEGEENPADKKAAAVKDDTDDEE